MTTIKPRDFIVPFASFTERFVCLRDRVWFVPSKGIDYEAFVFPGWSHCELFGNGAPVCVEYCSGNGSWVLAKALEHPEWNWVAVEKKLDRVKKIWAKAKNAKVNNLVVLYGEAYTATALYFPECSVQHVFVNFPDPWPKRRHAKYRLLNTPFLHQVSRVLMPEGTVTFVTDDENYSTSTIALVRQLPEYQFCYSEPYYTTHLEGYGTSFFDDLWRSKGKQIRYHKFMKNFIPKE